MRLFVGIDIPQEIKNTLAGLIDSMRPIANLRWSQTSNLHVTTKFIGEWPEARLGEVKAQLARMEHTSIPISIRGLGWFPNPHTPRVFWAAVRAPESLGTLAGKTEEALSALGIARETRPYSPHLTLARIENQPALAGLRRHVAALPSDDFGEFKATAFHLYHSQPGPNRSIYTKLESFPLTES
ncbi:MAG TPA: RNA 2',3'-cyclic phosphodiesterase [Bryobacteraceae bacterium]|nr:RNA 2',3'-cyclic phosphodiesterase [Bryobacteraceae bacterium]